MLIRVVETGKVLNEKELREFLYEETQEEDIQEYLNNTYPPVELPLYGATPAGDVLMKFLPNCPDDYEIFVEKYVRYYYDNIIYELKNFVGANYAYFKYYTLELAEKD
jgi:hypothetical protein